MAGSSMVYLDHNANSPLRASARRAIEAALDAWGNASSVHAPGRAARARIETAREQVARLADAPPGAVVFTSGASEANAFALRGAVAGALAAEDRITRLFVSAIEHDSVRANAAALAETVPGLKLSEIPVTKDGVVDLAALRLQLMQGKGRVLVSVMAVNNETGVVQDVGAIANLVKAEGGEDALFHIDAVQAAGRIELSFAASGADYMTLSAHKLGGPQGAGALIVKDGAPLAPLIAGGGQEMGRRGGTENVAGIAGFGAAAEEAMDFADAMARIQTLRDRFETELKRLAPDVVIFGADVRRLPNTSNFAIPGVAAETALIALDLDGVAVSSGAACSSGKVKLSHVLLAMGVDEALARGGLRVSFGWTNHDADVDAIITSLRRLIARRAALAA
ncbi:MAG TPA: cysteine desulfurase family protein [Micropepsaceae bacterium]|nr:cysteine desulfurase family protein [Micropepsaceae bacterium]